jgi:glycine reductase
LTSVRDVLEPRIKVEGPGMVYPGVCGRPVTTVGQGRTHRLAGVAVVEISDVEYYRGNDGWVDTCLDMAGPGAEASPFGSMPNLVIQLRADPRLGIEDQNDAVHKAALVVADRLAATTADLTPPQVETFELGPVDPSLPRVAYIQCLRSPQHYAGSLTAHWTGIYGLTRLTPPWLLHPNELLDSAISGRHSWVLANNPIVLDLYRRHGVDLDFAGVIAIRTRWSAQAEKDLTSLQAAKVARQIGARGAIVTYDAGGNDFMEVIRTVQACEQIGVKTVFVTFEEDPRTEGPALLEPLPEADAIVSTGIGAIARNGGSVELPPVERVIGAQELVAHTGTRQGRLAANGSLPGPRWGDPYGLRRWSCFGY